MTKARQVAQFTDPALDRQIKELIRAVNSTDDATEEVKDVVGKVIGVEIDDPTKARDGMLVVDARKEAWNSAVDYANKVNTVSDGENFSTIKQTAQEITGIVTGFGIDDPLNPGSYSLIRQGLDEIHLKVNKDEVISAINLSPEGVRVSGEKITLNGNVNIDGTFAINGQHIAPESVTSTVTTFTAVDDIFTSAPSASGMWFTLPYFNATIPPTGSGVTRVVITLNCTLGGYGNSALGYGPYIRYRLKVDGDGIASTTCAYHTNGSNDILTPATFTYQTEWDESAPHTIQLEYYSNGDDIAYYNTFNYTLIYLRR